MIATNRVILALDNLTKNEALNIASNISPYIWGFKLHDLLYDVSCGSAIIKELKEYGNVMADPKLYDIPKTMETTLRKIVDAGADIVTIHSISDFMPNDIKLLKYIAGVTILTTMSLEKLYQYYAIRDNIHGEEIGNPIEQLAFLSYMKRYKYIVCSGSDIELPLIKNMPIKKICPGIRLEDDIIFNDDQIRSVTPEKAIENGAEYIVIGRPLLKYKDDIYKMINVIKTINDKINQVVQYKPENNLLKRVDTNELSKYIAV